MIWSAACTTWEFISKVRCVVIRLTSSFTGSTFDNSSVLWYSGAGAVLAGVGQQRRAGGIDLLEQVLTQFEQAFGIDEVGQLELADDRIVQVVVLLHLDFAIAPMTMLGHVRGHGNGGLNNVSDLGGADHQLIVGVDRPVFPGCTEFGR